MKRFEKLAELRKASGFSQDELAEQLGVSRQSVSRWETGQAEPSPENLRAMCALYQVSADYLLLDGVTLKKGKLVTDGTVSGEESKECLEETPAEEKTCKDVPPTAMGLHSACCGDAARGGHGMVVHREV